MSKKKKGIGISIDEIIIYLNKNGFAVTQEFKPNGSSMWSILENKRIIYKNLTLSDLTYVVLKNMYGTFYTSK